MPWWLIAGFVVLALACAPLASLFLAWVWHAIRAPWSGEW